MIFSVENSHNYLDNCVHSSNHIAEHFLFLGRNLRNKSSHLAGLGIWHTESITQLTIFIDDARPWEQVQDSVENIPMKSIRFEDHFAAHSPLFV